MVKIVVVCLSLLLFVALQCGQQQQVEQQQAAQQSENCLPYASQTLPSSNILLICGDENGAFRKGTSAWDLFTKNRLELEMGHHVTIMTDTTAAPVMLAAADAADLVIMCESLISGAILTKLYTTATPVLSMENFLQDDFGLVNPESRRVDPGLPSDEDSLGTLPGYGVLPEETTLNIVNPSHPLAAGLSGSVQVYRFAREMNWGQDTVPSAEVIATLPNFPNSKAIYLVRKGAPLFGGTPAPGLRVQYYIENNNQTGTINLMTHDGYRLFDAAINYCLTTDLATHVASPTPPAPTGRYAPRPR
ncbi:hypothetical protein ACFL5H_01300 [Candidatus Latescibacterota bacterium]